MPNRSAALLTVLMATFVATLNSTGIIGVISVLAFPEIGPTGTCGVAVALAIFLMSHPVLYSRHRYRLRRSPWQPE